MSYRRSQLDRQPAGRESHVNAADGPTVSQRYRETSESSCA